MTQLWQFSHSADVDDQVPLAHVAPLTLRAWRINGSAPRHFSTCTRQELGPCCWCRCVCGLSGVSDVQAAADLDALVADSTTAGIRRWIRRI